MHDLSAILDVHGAALHALLYRVTLRADVADDLLQELFVRLAGSAALRAAADPAAYVKRAAINLALDWRRARRREPGGFDALPDPPSAAPSPLDALTDVETVGRILDASTTLSDLTREAFVMRYVQQESFEAIGAALGKTPDQARALCHAAVRRLREMLDPAGAATVEPEVRHG